MPLPDANSAFPQMNLRSHPGLAVGAAAILLAAATAMAIASGTVATGLADLPAALVSGLRRMLSDDAGAPTLAETVILGLRLPRVLLGLLAGAGLALAGALMQAFFRNPLADPTLIGVSGGAAVGAVAVIVLGSAFASADGAAEAPAGLAVAALLLPLSAFAGGLLAVLLVFRLARVGSRVDAATMLLAGIAINALAGAAIGFLIHVADDRQLRGLTFWTLGSLSGAGWEGVAAVGAALAVTLLGLRRVAPQLNALLLGEAESLHLGVAVEALKRRVLLLTALIAGAVVSACGIIAFVGLVAPHLARLCVGPDHRWLLPMSALLGAALLVAADWAARVWFAPGELPIGVLTALIGAPLFLALLRTSQRGGRE
jgi:iron complex transport system permease protein